MADKPISTNPSASSLPRVVPLSGPSGCCYTLRLNGHEVLVDAKKVAAINKVVGDL